MKSVGFGVLINFVIWGNTQTSQEYHWIQDSGPKIVISLEMWGGGEKMLRRVFLTVI